MNGRKILITVLAAAVCCSLAVTSAWAGHRKRSNSDSVTIRIGIDYGFVSLGNACYDSRPHVRRGYHGPPVYRPPVVRYHKVRRHDYHSQRGRWWAPPRHDPYGHWKKHHRHRNVFW